jgi:hypothetical protein
VTEFTGTSRFLVVDRLCVPVEIIHLMGLPLQEIENEEEEWVVRPGVVADIPQAPTPEQGTNLLVAPLTVHPVVELLEEAQRSLEGVHPEIPLVDRSHYLAEVVGIFMDGNQEKVIPVGALINNRIYY